MSMNTEQRPTEQNDATVAFLQSRDFHSALNSSIAALENTQGYYEASEDTNMLSSSSNNHSNSTGCLDESLLLSASDERTSTSSTTTATSSPSIYSHAILIPSTMMAEPAVVMPVLIFNAALTHHLVAKQDDESMSRHTRTHMLQRAKQLYELAYDQGQDNDLLFHFAIITNVALIEREIGNVSTANNCFSYLRSMLVFFVDEGNDAYLRHIERFAPFIIADLECTCGIEPTCVLCSLN